MNEYLNKSFSFDLREEFFEIEQNFFFSDDDSMFPYVSFGSDFSNPSICIMFRKNGVEYFLSEESGYFACRGRIFRINDISKYTWQLSKLDFIRVKKWMLESLDYCLDEYKELCLDAISKLDYEKGRRNAHFQIITDDNDTEIERIRFNFRDLYYDLMLNNNSMFRGIIDDPWSHLNKKEIKGLEKKLVLSIMNNSKTIKNKIKELEK